MVDPLSPASAVHSEIRMQPGSRGPSRGNALTGRCCRDAWRSCALLEGTLLALGTLCMEREESRKQLMEAKVLGQIVRALDNQLAGGRPTREIMHVTFV